MKFCHRPGPYLASTILILLAGLSAIGCSEQNTSQRDSIPPSLIQQVPWPQPSDPIILRSASEVADLIQGTCLKAAYESASALRFEAIVKGRGLNLAPKPDRGRLRVWQAPGVEIAYSGEPKGAAEGVLCHLRFDPRGIPKAKQVARAIEPLLPATYKTVLPPAPIKYGWEFSAPANEHNNLAIGDMPELCDHELGCTPPVLDVLFYHAKFADSR